MLIKCDSIVCTILVNTYIFRNQRETNEKDDIANKMLCQMKDLMYFNVQFCFSFYIPVKVSFSYLTAICVS